MRILVLAIHYWPEQTGIGAVLTRRCEYLASIGHEVTVCTGMPFYPEWRVRDGYTDKLFFSEKHNRVKILRSWLWMPKTVTAAKRVLIEASFLASSLLRIVFNRKPDLLLVVSPPLGLALAAVLMSRLWNVPYLFDVEDLQPDAAADLGMLPRPVLPLLYRMEAMAYRNATMISTVSEGMRQKIVSKEILADKVVVVPPPADSNLFNIGDRAEAEKFRKKHGFGSKIIVAHSGNMGVKQGLSIVLDVALRLREQPDITFLLAGDGVMKSHLQSRAMGLKLDNIKFLPVQEQPEFLQMLAAVDVALIVQQATVSDIVFPSKTVTLLSAARPLVAAVSVNSEIDRVIRESGGGVVTEPENVDAFASNIERLCHDPELRSAMGKCGRSYALQHWDEARVLPNFESYMLRARGEFARLVPKEDPLPDHS
jgi:colanic acid biosynthesis glycosyl transferase WcaI